MGLLSFFKALLTQKGKEDRGEILFFRGEKQYWKPTTAKNLVS
jgi:hypothetical protein